MNFEKLCGGSITGRLGALASEKIQASFFGGLLRRFLNAEDAAENSIYGRFLLFVSKKLGAAGVYLRESFFYSLILKIGSFFGGKIKQSRLFSPLLNGGLNRFVLLLFALYLPLTKLLREALNLGFFASVFDELLLFFAAATVFCKAALKGPKGSTRASNLEVALVFYISIMFMLMCFVCPDGAVAFEGFRAQTEYALWFFIVLRLIESPDDAKALVIFFTGIVFIMALHGILQFIVGVEIPASWMTSSESAVRTRVFSITGSPNVFGSLLVMAAPIAVSFVYYFKKPWQKLFSLGAAGLICLCDLFTFSRSSWGGLALAAVVFSFLVDKRILLLLAAAVAGMLTFLPSVASRLTFLFSKEYEVASAVGGRSLRWAVGKDLLMSGSPWLGFGLGRFGGAVAMNNQSIDTADGFQYFYMDNYYLKTMVESGYIGLAAFLFLLVVLFVSGLKATRGLKQGPGDALLRNTGSFQLLSSGIFSGLLGVLFHSFFENIFEEPYMMAYFWGLAAVLIWAMQHKKKEAGAEGPLL